MSTADAHSLQQLEKDRKFVLENEWMIRPCAVYNGEYSNCKSFKARFYQYYRDGQLHDCNDWYNTHFDCKRYTAHDDYAAGARLIKSEMKRLDDRINAHKANNVWKPREKRPPPNWTAPLPPHIESYEKESYFLGREEEMRHGYDSASKSRCVIS